MSGDARSRRRRYLSNGLICSIVDKIVTAFICAGCKHPFYGQSSLDKLFVPFHPV